jgi:hypothetical protein
VFKNFARRGGIMAHRNAFGLAVGFLLSCFADAQSAPDAQAFAAIRAAVRETIQGHRNFKLFLSGMGGAKAYDLYLCNEAYQLGMAESPLRFAATVALHAEIYQAELTRLRVPESIWGRQLATLDQFGARSMQDAQRRSYEQLDDELRRVEKSMADPVIAWGQSSAQLPRFAWEGGCGAGEAEVTITTTPRGARVSYISLFQYKLCQVRNLNADDPARCDGWINAVKLTEDMIGKYHYIATWPDGYQAKGIFDITGKTTVNIPR